MSTEPTMTAAAAAAWAGVSIDTIRDALKAGRLKAFRPTPTGHYRIPESALTEWLTKPVAAAEPDDGWDDPDGGYLRRLREDPNKEPDWTIDLGGRGYVTDLGKQMKDFEGRHHMVSNDLRLVFQKYDALRKAGASVAEARTRSGYDVLVVEDWWS